MPNTIQVEIAPNGNTMVAATGQFLGRTSLGRPPRDQESLEVRTSSGDLVGWVVSLGEGLQYRLTPNAFYAAVPLDELERQLGEYRAEPSFETLSLLTTMARQLAGIRDNFSPADDRRFASIMGELMDLLTRQLSSFGVSASGAEGIAGVAGLPLVADLFGGPMLFAAGTTFAPPPVRPGPVPFDPKLFKGPVIPPTGGIGAGAAGVGLFFAALTLAWQIWILAGIAAAAAATLAEAFKRLVRLLERAYGTQVRAWVRSTLLAVVGAEFFDCVNKCVQKFLEDMANAFGAAELSVTPDDPNPMELLFNLHAKHVLALAACLRSCGLTDGMITALRKALEDELLDQVNRLVKLLSKGRLSPPSFGMPAAGRETAREHRNTPLGRYHRKGGFGFVEFPDDREERPDITAEDEREPVDPADLEVNPNLDLQRFSCIDLALRHEALSRRLQELTQERDELVKSIQEALASSDPAIVDGARGQIAALKTVRQEINAVSIALYNVIVEMLERPCEELSVDQGRTDLEMIRRVRRDTQSTPAFGE